MTPRRDIAPFRYESKAIVDVVDTPEKYNRSSSLATVGGFKGNPSPASFCNNVTC